MVRYGGMSEGIGILGIIILAAFLSIFSGLAGMIIKKVAIPASYGIAPLFLIPFIWVVKDLVISKIFGGFPWCLAGYSQYNNIYFVQLAEIGGIHLITFLLIFFNILFYKLLRNIKQRRILIRFIIVIVVSFICIYNIGYYLYWNSSKEILPLKTHRAGIIQPNTGNDPIGYSKKNRILNRLFSESRQLTEEGAEFIVWPEHTVSIYPLQTPSYLDRFTHFVNANVPLIAGFTDLNSDRIIYNSAILFKEDGIEKYDKIHLTPFGEYVLFREILFFVKRITDEIVDFTPGESFRNLNVQNHLISVPICYEVIFPNLVRKFIALGGELIVTISNDSWFGDTSAPYQHLSMATFRCIENRRFLLRSTSNGISAVVNPVGEVLTQTQYNTADRFIGEFKYISHKTIFTRYGYLFPYFCLAVLVVYLVAVFVRDRKNRKNN